MDEQPVSLSGHFRKSLVLERNINVLLLALVLLRLSEELWSSFVPKYLEALGAGVFVWTGLLWYIWRGPKEAD